MRATVVTDPSAIKAAADRMTEADLQRAVMDLAAFLGLLVFHSGDSRRDSTAGFPDLVIVGKRTLFRELKTSGGRVRVEQQRWISRLSRAQTDAAVWRPMDLLNGTIHAQLKAIR